MKRLLIILLMAVLLPLTVTAAPVQAQSEPGYYQMSDQDGYLDDYLLYPEELDDLLARIALYPDPLIAQILPAATFVDQIHDAANFVRLYGDTPRIDYQPWDFSVRAVAHYPQVLYMMDREYQWTASVGQAYIEQPQDVMDAIQRLRRFAYDQGNLFSTRQQQVFFEGDVIRIVPGRPEYVYVPVYDPTVVYVERYYPSSPFITFSVGFAIGPWLNRDCNWRERRVYYHGWRGGGWITRSRPYVHDRRGIYINRRAATITINERVVQRDTRRYREQLRVETRRHRDEGRMPPVRVEPRRPRVEQPRPGKVEQVRPGKVEQVRPGKVEQVRPGKVQQGTERRSEPWNRRETAPAPGVPAPATKPGTPPPAAQRQPAPTQPKEQPQVQPAPQQQAPAATKEPTGRTGKGESRGDNRRRIPRPMNRPGAEPPAATTAPAPATAAPAVRGAAPHAQPAEPAVRGAAPHAPAAAPAVKAPAATPPVPAAPVRPVTPRVEKPRIAPTPPPAATPAPRAEPAEPARPVREFEPGQGRGRGESSGGRALQREER